MRMTFPEQQIRNPFQPVRANLTAATCEKETPTRDSGMNHRPENLCRAVVHRVFIACQTLFQRLHEVGSTSNCKKFLGVPGPAASRLLFDRRCLTINLNLKTGSPAHRMTPRGSTVGISQECHGDRVKKSWSQPNVQE
jgi:hypothetical protein